MIKGSVAWAVIGLAAVAAAVTAGGLPAQEKEREAEKEQAKEHREAPRAHVWAGAFSADGRSWLGVYIEEVDREAADRLRLPEVRGALVREVVEESPAAQAGLGEDDVIVSWNGSRVESAIQLRRLVRETPPGREVRLGVVRDGTEREIRVTLDERRLPSFEAPRVHVERLLPEMQRLEEMGERMRHHADGARFLLFSGRGRLGVTLRRLGEQLGSYFGVEDGRGALVASVREDSPAEKAGLRAGDVIVRIGEREISGPSDVTVAVGKAEPGPITITVVRDGERQTLTAELPEREEAGVRSFHFELPPGHGEWEIRAPAHPGTGVPAPAPAPAPPPGTASV